jgi:hypothetical protein
MTDTTVDAVAQREQLEAKLAALTGEATVQQAALDANQHARAHLEARIENIRFAAHALANVAPRIAAETKWLAELTDWRKTICDELLACPPRPRTDLDRGKVQNLTLSIQVIDRGLGVVADSGWSLNTLRLGQLMRGAGYVEGPRIANQVSGALPWFGSLPEVEHRLKGLQAQRDDAQRRLDAALRKPTTHRLVAEAATSNVAGGEAAETITS